MSNYNHYLLKYMTAITKKTALIGVVILAALLAVVKFVWKPAEEKKMPADTTPKTTDTMRPAPTPATPAPTTPAPAAMADPQATVMETATGKKVSVVTRYQNPGGSDEVGFDVVVDKNGVVTEATANVLAVNATSKLRQGAFAKDFPAALKGKKLSELTKIDRVGGSSLTTGAFNAVLPSLKTQL